MIAIAKYLPRDEFKLTVCSLRGRGYKETAPLLEKLGVPCFVGQFRPKGQSWQYALHFFSWLKDQRKIDVHGPFDIQHSLDYVSVPFEVLMSKWKSRKFVYSQGNMNEAGSALMLRLKIRAADHIIAISDSVQDLVLAHGASREKVEKIYLGIDLEELDQRMLSNSQIGKTKSILNVSRIIPKKRQEFAIQAFRQIADEFPDLRLRFAGNISDPEYYEKLVQMVQDFQLSNRVEFLGARNDILEVMQQSDALLHCAEAEGFGWVIVEAMSVGLPVIASAVDGPKMILDANKTGILVDNGNVEGFSNAMRSILTDTQRSRTMAKNARRAVEERFSAKFMVERIARVYRGLFDAKELHSQAS